MKFETANKGLYRVAKLLLSGVALERLSRAFPSLLRFVAVFLVVYVADNFGRFFLSQKRRPVFLEEILGGLLLYGGFALFAWWLDGQAFVYTGRHASPAVPAVILALLDRAWPAPRLLGRGR